jgi:hypothetical protein
MAQSDGSSVQWPHGGGSKLKSKTKAKKRAERMSDFSQDNDEAPF